MPFSTDTNWPQGLINIFNSCHKARLLPFETRYNGAYEKLINYALDIGSNFSIYISLPPISDESGTVGTFRVVVNKERRPFLIVDMRDETWERTPETRQRADTLMRQRYSEMLHQCPLRYMYGLSFMGTSLRVYRGDKATGDITPHVVDCPKALPRDFLEGQWNVNILSPEGFTTIQEIVTYINAEKVNIVE